MREREKRLTLEVIQPSNRLVTLIEEFADTAVSALELFEEIKEQAYTEGFSGYDLRLLLQYHLKKKMASRTLSWYLKMLEDSSGRNRQLADIDDKILPEDIQIFQGDCREEASQNSRLLDRFDIYRSTI